MRENSKTLPLINAIKISEGFTDLHNDSNSYLHCIIECCFKLEVSLYVYTNAYFRRVDDDDCGIINEYSEEVQFPLESGGFKYMRKALYALNRLAIFEIAHRKMPTFGFVDLWSDAFIGKTITSQRVEPFTGILNLNGKLGIPYCISTKKLQNFEFSLNDLYINIKDVDKVLLELKITKSSPTLSLETQSTVPTENNIKLKDAIIHTLLTLIQSDANEENLSMNSHISTVITDSSKKIQASKIADLVNSNAIKYFANKDQFKSSTISRKINKILKDFE